MNWKSIFLLPILFFIASTMSKSQEQFPFQEIPDYPEEYTPTTIVARMIEGVGFRYYWGTEGLRPEDLDYKPSEEARTSRETLNHIFGLSQTIVNASRNQVNVYEDGKSLSFEELRSKTLKNFQEASEIMRNDPDGDLANYRVLFNRGGETSEYPYWNLINGPIEDAAWHVGQIVSFRRASGNPFSSKASLFSGKLRK